MPRNDNPSFWVTPNRLSFLLSVFAILAILYQGVSYAKEQEFRVSTLEERIAERDKAVEKLTTVVGEVRDEVKELIVIVKGRRLTYDLGPSPHVADDK